MADTARWKTVGVCSYWLTLPLQIPLVVFFFPVIDFFRAFIYEADLLVEIWLDELESFPAGLEEDVVKFRNRCARSHFLEHLPWSDWYHIDHQGYYLPIYCEEGYDYSPRYSWASEMSSSRRTSPLVSHLLQFQSVLFKLGGWPNCLFVLGQSFSVVRNLEHCSVRWGSFPW